MNRLIYLVVTLLVVADIYTLTLMQQWRSRPVAPDLTARVDQLEKDLSQAQQDIGQLKQEMAIEQRRGAPPE